MDDLADDELLSMYANGDPEAFDTLFDRHRTPVYNFACTMLNDFARAEDVMQETFLSVARAAKKYHREFAYLNFESPHPRLPRRS